MAAVLPVDWSGHPHGIRVSIAPLDDFDMPMEKRGFKGDLPTDKAEYDAFADNVAASVRSTVMFILTGKIEGDAA